MFFVDFTTKISFWLMFSQQETIKKSFEIQTVYNVYHVFYIVFVMQQWFEVEISVLC